MKTPGNDIQETKHFNLLLFSLLMSGEILDHLGMRVKMDLFLLAQNSLEQNPFISSVDRSWSPYIVAGEIAFWHLDLYCCCGIFLLPSHSCQSLVFM